MAQAAVADDGGDDEGVGTSAADGGVNGLMVTARETKDQVSVLLFSVIVFVYFSADEEPSGEHLF